jgi:hypothetical protein
MRKLTGLAVIALFLVASLPVSGAGIWSTDFDGGIPAELVNGRDAAHLGAPAPGNRPTPACDANVGSNTCEDGVGRLLDAGGGNLVYYSENWAFGSCRGLVGLRGTTAYNRSDGPEAIARHFIIAAAPEGGEANGAAAGIFGPFHRNAGTASWGGAQTGAGNHAAACSAAPATPGSLEADLELGTHHWPGWKQTYVDGSRTSANCLNTSSPPCPELMNAGGYREVQLPAGGVVHTGAQDTLADQSSTGSWWTRGKLGTVNGGLLQWATSYDPGTGVANGGAGWTTIKDSAGTDIDTRGSGGDAGTAATVYLGYGGFKHAGLAEIYYGDDTSPVPVELSGWSID